MIVSFIKGKVIQTVLCEKSSIAPRRLFFIWSYINRSELSYTHELIVAHNHVFAKVWKLNESFKTVTELFNVTLMIWNKRNPRRICRKICKRICNHIRFITYEMQMVHKDKKQEFVQVTWRVAQVSRFSINQLIMCDAKSNLVFITGGIYEFFITSQTYWIYETVNLRSL